MIGKVFAANTINTQFGNVTTVPEYIAAIYSWILGFGVSIAVVWIIVSGYILMTSQGSPDAVSNAKKNIIESLSGIALLFLAKLVIDSIWKPF
ncbi:MAG: hypothetical protein WCW17_01275 [Patescibacteria group bacterium]